MALILKVDVMLPVKAIHQQTIGENQDDKTQDAPLMRKPET